MKIRIGTLYRIKLLSYFKKLKIDGPVLDIGCHNGEILDRIDAPLKIGIDLDIKNYKGGVNFVRADANHLPFKKESFAWISILDVIEHIEDERLLSENMFNCLKTSGSFFLTTPSKDIHMFPGFLTGFISNKWGHFYRRGYAKSTLSKLFSEKFNLTFHEWNAQWWRFFYLFIRGAALFSTAIASKMIDVVFKMDSSKSDGMKGYLILEGTPKNG
ncbi:class I SAM-dependent methyltransferase [bacterium]|nr:class I SAM-dependent methyltransferase [bacterium]